MTKYPSSTIALLLFVTDPDLNFAHLVGETDRLIREHEAGPPQTSWPGEDAVFFDCGPWRLLLAQSDGPVHGHAACIALAAGPASEGSSPAGDATRASLCATLRAAVAHIQALQPEATVIWHEAEVALDLGMLEVLTGALDHDPDAPDEPEAVEAPDRDLVCLRQMRDAMTAEAAEAAAPPPADPAPGLFVLNHDRTGAQLLNIALIATALPIGTALAAHSVLRGGSDFALSARTTALTGVLAAGLHLAHLGDLLPSLT